MFSIASGGVKFTLCKILGAKVPLDFVPQYLSVFLKDPFLAFLEIYQMLEKRFKNSKLLAILSRRKVSTSTILIFKGLTSELVWKLFFITQRSPLTPEISPGYVLV
jgi:hypothetical protein